jgi:hypothetical protein
VADHGAKQADSAVDVDHVVVQWSFAGLANGLKQTTMRERLIAIHAQKETEDIPSEQQSE